MVTIPGCATGWKPEACITSWYVAVNHQVIVPDATGLGTKGRVGELVSALDGRVISMAFRYRLSGQPHTQTTGFKKPYLSACLAHRTAGAGTKGDRVYAWSRIRINGPEHIIRWSLWRRHHQYRAQHYHYKAHRHTLQTRP